MNSRRSALGRGLGALIPDATPPASEPATAAAGAPIELDVALIDPNPAQPRRVFDPEQLERLADSIRQHGVLQPVVVRRSGERYELIVGERRFRASQRAGRSTLPAVVADVAPQELLELALVENVQRQDLNPIELALAFRELAAGGATQEEIGQRVGLERSTVANHLRLLELPREIQTDIEGGKLGIGHAKALLSVSNPERRRHLRDRIVGGQLSVRAAEDLARASGNGAARAKPRSRAPSDPNLAHLLDALREHLKTRVRISGTGARGRIEIDYFGPEDLHRLVSAILGDR